jgi:O-antigen/teichoic acid export membrane protein
MRRARAHASPIVTAGIVTGAQGYHGRVTVEAAGGAHEANEANEATRGSAVKLVAEVASRLLGFATTFLLIRGLRAAAFGAFTALSAYALLLGELGELGLQALASRALVARTLSLGSLVRARLVLAPLVVVVAVAAATAAPELASRFGVAALDGPALALLVIWFALSGWGEFMGVALRCLHARRQEATLLVVLRGGALAFAAAALAAGASLRGVALGLGLSPLPALGLGAVLLRRAAPKDAFPRAAPASVLRESFPLAVHGALLLLSPRVELVVLPWLLAEGDPALGFFSVAVNVIWFLSMVPTAIVAGAMPALTREALRGKGPVRRRTAATLAVAAAPAAVGLALVALPLAGALLGAGYAASGYGAVAACLRIMALGLPAIFLNALMFGALIAAGRASWLPRLTAARVALAFVLAFVLVPAFGGRGASAGLVCAEWALLAAGTVACRRASFAIPVVAPVAWALVACVPMALAVNGVRDSLPLAVLIGAVSWAATLAAVARLRPGLARELVGGLR